jgi:hypothetical protein
VAEVFSDINVGLALVEDGQAFVYRRYLGQCDAQEYRPAETRASRRRHGVWDVPGGITRPWDFRRGRRSSGSVPRSERATPDVVTSAAVRSVHGRGPSDCCGRDTPPSMGMVMAWPANPSAAAEDRHSSHHTSGVWRRLL